MATSFMNEDESLQLSTVPINLFYCSMTSLGMQPQGLLEWCLSHESTGGTEGGTKFTDLIIGPEWTWAIARDASSKASNTMVIICKLLGFFPLIPPQLAPMSCRFIVFRGMCCTCPHSPFPKQPSRVNLPLANSSSLSYDFCCKPPL